MAITSIGSRGTNVAGTGNNQSIAVTMSSSVAAGSVLIIFIAKTGATALTGVSDTKSNAWSFLGKYRNATNGNIYVEAWMSLVSNALTTSDSVTATWGVNETDICAAVWNYGVAAGKTLALTTGTTNPITNEVNGTTGFGSVAFSGLASLSRLYLRVAGKQANSTTGITASTNFTSWALTIRSRNNSSASIARAEHRINTSTGETSNPTLAVTGNTAGLFFALEEVANTQAYTGLAAAGSYVLAGTSAKPPVAYGGPAAPGNYAATGDAATGPHGFGGPAVAGTYSIGGAAAGATLQWHGAAAAGGYALQGALASGPVRTQGLAGPGAYTIVGASATGVYSGSGAIAYTGLAAAGQYTIAGTAALGRVAAGALATPGGGPPPPKRRYVWDPGRQKLLPLHGPQPAWEAAAPVLPETADLPAVETITVHVPNGSWTFHAPRNTLPDALRAARRATKDRATAEALRQAARRLQAERAAAKAAAQAMARAQDARAAAQAARHAARLATRAAGVPYTDAEELAEVWTALALAGAL